MKIADLKQKIQESIIEDGKSIKLFDINAKDVITNEGSKIVHQLHTGSFSDIIHHHEVRKGETYGIYYQRSVTGCDKNGDRVTLEKLKFPTFDLETEDGNIAIRQGKIM